LRPTGAKSKRCCRAFLADNNTACLKTPKSSRDGKFLGTWPPHPTGDLLLDVRNIAFHIILALISIFEIIYISMTQEIILKRLSIIKRIYAIGVAEAEKPEITSFTSVLSFHDSIECF
jgi:hypothetical protein